MLRKRLGFAAMVLAGPLAGVTPGFAAQVFVQPVASIGAETNSNLDLTPGGDSETTGYMANVATLIGIATPNSSTTIRPRLEYRDYPTDKADNRLEEYLDVNSFYKGLRSTASISGTLDHRDELNAELANAQYDDVNPVQPTAPQTGRTQVGATRDSVYLVPSYKFNWTPRLATGVSAIYQKVNYSPNDDDRYVDFDYYQGKGFVVLTLSPTADLTFGGFGNKYNATRYDSTANATGVSVDLNNNWTPLFSTQASISGQHSDIQSTIPPGYNGTVNTWGGSLSAIYKAETQNFRADLGRMLTPSGGGSVYIINQLQFQYERHLTQRLDLTTAAVVLRTRALTAQFSDDGRDYFRSLVDLKYMLTRTLFIQGGYQYTTQKYQLDPDGAANNRLYLRFGYQGLDRQW